MYKIYITEKKNLPRQGTVEAIRKAGFESQYVPIVEEHEFAEKVKDADVILVGTEPLVTEEVMIQLPNLKMIARAGVGVDSVDLLSATNLEICVTNTPNVNFIEVAEHTVTLILATLKKLILLNNETKAGTWSKNPNYLRQQWTKMGRIAGKTIGIYGLGKIGQTVARRLNAFAPRRIIAYDPFVEQFLADEYNTTMVDFETLVRESDILTLHCPSTPENYHIFDRKRFSQMKKGSIFINCARGSLMNDKDLLAALQNGHLLAAAIDVLEVEPIEPDHPLLKQENLIITPHIAAGSDITGEQMAIRWGENAVNILTGKRLHGLANPTVLEKIVIQKHLGNSKWNNIPTPNV